MRDGREAAEYGAEIRRLVRYLGVGNGNMQVRSLAVFSRTCIHFSVLRTMCVTGRIYEM